MKTYECEKCKYQYQPELKERLFATEIDKKIYLQCPKCKSYSWHHVVTERK